MNFISEPPIPKKRPDITTFIHRPLQHFRDILKLIQMIAQNCPSDSEEHKNFSSVINELQAAYREITVGGGLMEPLGEGRPLLSLQDLESRLVFTKCKPFILSVPGRQWIFGGDLSRIDGRSVKQFWTLLFSDIIVFAKVSRDRVLFITDEPLPLKNIADCCFNVRKKSEWFIMFMCSFNGILMFINFRYGISYGYRSQWTASEKSNGKLCTRFDENTLEEC
jgi:hypothetical protein